MTSRDTRQLRATFDVLAAATDHPTAEQVFRRVRRRVPRVSLGTVYRNLEKLQAQGRVRQVRVARGPVRYDALAGEHDHFMCEACAAVIDLKPQAVRDVSRLRRVGFVIRAQSVALYGLCRDCAAAAPGISRPATPVRDAGRRVRH